MTRLLPSAILLAGLAGTLVVSAEPTAGFTSPIETTEPTIPPTPVGMVGCASSNCHGRSEGTHSDKDAWRNSCNDWASKDPHARAYDVLKGDLAKKIQAKLGRKEAGYEDPRCLACHSNPSLANEKKPDYVALRTEGVSCEACHGNAAVWLTSHRSTKRETKAWPGFVDLYDLGSRALACAGCHVGAPGRDMNHDMIAAGHPRLNFEFASHLARLPKHWRERDRKTDKDRGPEHLLQAWVVGQFAVGEAACELSIDRQKRNDPWPELAEWNCYACHHALMGKGWRPSPEFLQQKSAVWTLPWPLGDSAAADVLEPGLGKRVEVLTKAVGPTPDAQRIHVVSQLLEVLQKDRPQQPPDVERIFHAIEATKTIPDWDTGYRIYLTLGVLEMYRWDVRKPSENTKIAAAFKELEKALSLPGHPKESTFEPEKVYEGIVKLKTELRAAWPGNAK